MIRKLLSDFPQLDKERIDDVIVGNATPEAEQGLNIGRMVSLMGLDTDKVPGMTVNRYCASGLETIAIASAKIHAGLADCILAGGIETMSPIPFGGWRIVPNARVAKANPDWYWGMGLTAEAVAKDFNVSREDQDAFALESHQRAAAPSTPVDSHRASPPSPSTRSTSMKTKNAKSAPTSSTPMKACAAIPWKASLG